MDKEDIESLQDKALRFIKSNFLILALFSAGLIFLSIGLIQIFGAKKVAIEFEKGEKLGSKEQAQKIKVDVEGQVMKPGLYSLTSDARVQDALIAAGGLTPDANRKAINLAQKLSDGAKIYIPAAGDTGVLGGSAITEYGSTGLISVNSASQVELEKLPAIGPVTAGKIIDGRPYGSVQELLDRKVVGKATYEKIKELISL